MRNIADQFLAFLIILHLFLTGLLKTDPHLLKILTELPDLILILYLQGKVQIPVADLLGGLLKLPQGPQNGAVNPECQKESYSDQNCQSHKQHFRNHGLYFRNKFIHAGDDKHRALAVIREAEIHLLKQVLAVAVQIYAAFQIVI